MSEILSFVINHPSFGVASPERMGRNQSVSAGHADITLPPIF